jgi:hypothetical protein
MKTAEKLTEKNLAFRLGDEVRIGTELGIIIGLPQPALLAPPHLRDGFPPGLFLVAVQDRIMALAAELLILHDAAPTPAEGLERAAHALKRIADEERRIHWSARRA